MADGHLIVHAGSTRSGKSLAVKRAVRRAERVMVWDPKGEYVSDLDFTAIRGTQLLDIAAGKLSGRYAFVATDLRRQFGLWCSAAWHWSKFGPPGSIVVAEETADVTTPGKAPAAWGTMLRQGLGFGLTIYAITQRPAESDKTSLGNATVIRCWRLTRALDRRAMAAELDVDPARVTALSAGQYLERDCRTGRVATRTLRLSAP